jgi:hypothetical protein
MLGHTLHASYYPLPGFSVSPFITLSDEYYDSDDSNTTSQSLGFSILKKLKDNRVTLSAYTSFYQNRNRTWSYDNEGVYTRAGLTWRLNNDSNYGSKLGLFLTHNRYTDKVFAGSNIDDTAVWLTYRITSPQPLFLYDRRDNVANDPFAD